MNKLLEINRELREIPDPHLKSRELFIKKIEATYGYDRENAEKAYEYMKYQRGKVVLGGLCGGVAVAVARPLQRTAENYNAIFRKPWMKVPILGAAFVCGAYGGIQLPSRIFYKLTPSRNVGITHSVYTASNDMVSKFRLFETFENPNPKGNIADYLSLYGTEALTKSEMIDNIALHALKEFNVAQLFQVKRRGKDTDPLFWSFGKIHGLENIAFADPDELKETKGNPVKIQKIVDRYENSPIMIDSYEHLVQETQDALRNYREKIDSLNLNSSDRKKLLALPFYMSKRSQLPSPRKGQTEYKLFSEITHQQWFDDTHTDFDTEHKITEFDYENYFDPFILKKNKHLTDSEDFKTLVKALNLFSKTKYERLRDNKESFQQLMPLFRGLSDSEAEILLHKLQNNTDTEADRARQEYFDEATHQLIEKKLAKISEDENYLEKNRYRLEKTKLDYAEKKRMPIDERKVKDILRNRPALVSQMRQELQTYEPYRERSQFENGVLSYLNESAFGDMRALLDDVGIVNASIPFMNVSDIQKKRDQLYTQPSDHQFQYLMNALYTPIDMTDYEDNFVGYDEFGGLLPLSHTHTLRTIMEEPFPQTNMLPAMEEIENKPKWARSKIHKEMQDAKALEAEADDEEDEEEEGDEEEGDEEEGGEEEGAEEGAEEEEEEEPSDWPPKTKVAAAGFENPYFARNETLRNKFNEVELDSFMKLLNVKPTAQWEDKSSYHNKMGVHTYEDDAQQLDPAFHLLGEVERQFSDKLAVEEFRRGTEVKFSVSDKRPTHYNYRF